MSDELRLPDELAAIEARLAAHPLPASPLNRDELLYQAGWAACEAKLAATSHLLASSLREPKHPSRAIVAWSLTSAALAASLAVAVTLALAPDRAPTLAVEGAGGSRPPLASVVETTTAAAPAPRSDEVDRVLANLDALLRLDRSLPTASLWAALGSPRRQPWDEPIVASVDATAPAASSPDTARGLLEELLPRPRGAAAPAAMPWLQRFSIPGEETI
jgi:hypothetical protein